MSALLGLQPQRACISNYNEQKKKSPFYKIKKSKLSLRLICTVALTLSNSSGTSKLDRTVDTNEYSRLPYSLPQLGHSIFNLYRN